MSDKIPRVAKFAALAAFGALALTGCNSAQKQSAPAPQAPKRPPPTAAPAPKPRIVHPHNRPVPILMYHVVGTAPPGAPFPSLYVRRADFAGQLAWLRAELAIPAAEGTVLVFHHPPTIEPGAQAHMIRLRGADQLEAAVRNTDVVAVLAGHVHHPIAGPFGTAFCSAAPAIAYTVDPLALAAGTLQGIPGTGFNLVRIAEGRAVASTMIVSA